MPIIKRSNLILPRLPQPVISQLFATAPLRHLKVGEALFRAGDHGDGCYRIEQGLVKICGASSTHQERILAILGPTAIIGELALIDGLPRSASVVAMRSSTFRFVSRNEFSRCTEQFPELYRYLTSILTARLREADEALILATFLSTKGRIAGALLELADYLGEKFDDGLRLSHKIDPADIAAMTGATTKDVIDVLAQWKERKLLTINSQRLCLHDLSAIEQEMALGENFQSEGERLEITRRPK